MTEPADRVGAYLALVLGGARFEDERLTGLRGLMTAAEIDAVKQRLIAGCIEELPLDSSAPPSDMTHPPDIVDLYLAIVRRGARPDDRRLAILAELMSGEEFERARQAIGELWLRAEPTPARPN